jgi:hypothetical protein
MIRQTGIRRRRHARPAVRRRVSRPRPRPAAIERSPYAGAVLSKLTGKHRSIELGKLFYWSRSAVDSSVVPVIDDLLAPLRSRH